MAQPSRLPTLGEPGCIVPRDSRIPGNFVAGRGELPSTVLAMTGGASDYLTKHLDEDALMRAIDATLARVRVFRKEAEDTAALQVLYRSPTTREQEISPLPSSGRLNKQVAAVLGITEYTAQIHHGRIIGKMQEGSLGTLIRRGSKQQLKASSTTTFEA